MSLSQDPIKPNVNTGSWARGCWEVQWRLRSSIWWEFHRLLEAALEGDCGNSLYPWLKRWPFVLVGNFCHPHQNWADECAMLLIYIPFKPSTNMGKQGTLICPIFQKHKVEKQALAILFI
jgi:hypothetical protein